MDTLVALSLFSMILWSSMSLLPAMLERFPQQIEFSHDFLRFQQFAKDLEWECMNLGGAYWDQPPEWGMDDHQLIILFSEEQYLDIQREESQILVRSHAGIRVYRIHQNVSVEPWLKTTRGVIGLYVKYSENELYLPFGHQCVVDHDGLG